MQCEVDINPEVDVVHEWEEEGKIEITEKESKGQRDLKSFLLFSLCLDGVDKFSPHCECFSMLYEAQQDWASN